MQKLQKQKYNKQYTKLFTVYIAFLYKMVKTNEQMLGV